MTFQFGTCLIAIGLVLALTQGCTGPTRKEAVPAPLTTEAVISGLEDVRYRVGIDNEAILREGVASVRREQAYLASKGFRGALSPAIFLAVSGGGDDGAFGAGLLNGWTQAGNRPDFKLVTGVSTGALIAPFAFLGPAYDGTFKRFYTDVAPDDIVKKRSILAAITSDGVGPLKSMLPAAAMVPPPAEMTAFSTLSTRAEKSATPETAMRWATTNDGEPPGMGTFSQFVLSRQWLRNSMNGRSLMPDVMTRASTLRSPTMVEICDSWGSSVPKPPFTPS